MSNPTGRHSAAWARSNPVRQLGLSTSALQRTVSILVFALCGFAFSGLFGPAANAAGCPNEAFRTGFGAALPDCRAYEQVSPTDKNGTSVGGAASLSLAAESGSAVTFYSSNGTTIPAEGAASAQDFPTFLASRLGETWTSQRLLPPQSYGEHATFLGATPDMRYVLEEVERGTYESPGYGRGLFVMNTSGGAPVEIVPYEDDEENFEYAFDGASLDGTRLFFETKAAVTLGSYEFEDNLYMWDRETGQVTLVGLLPVSEGGEEPEAGSFGGAYEWYEGTNTAAGGALDGLAVGALHAVDPSGSQIYFTASGTGQLYLRRGLTGGTPSTLRVSQPNTGVLEAPEPKPAAFQEATPDGEYAFFLSGAPLTTDANTGSNEEGSDLYRFDANAPEGSRLTDMTALADTETPSGAEVIGLLGISSDGSSGYLVARGVLASGGSPGAENLYRFAEVNGTINFDFVAILRPNAETESTVLDSQNWSPRNYEGENTYRNPYVGRSARVTSNGDVLLFSSAAPLTGFRNVGSECQDARNSFPPATGTEEEVRGRCAQLFRYQASPPALQCISCGQTSESPFGSASLITPYFNLKQSPMHQAPAVVFTRNLSTDGDRVFFQTPQPLNADDTNGASECPGSGPFGTHAYNREHQCQDVYEWEAPGTPGGTCQQPEDNGGCLYLLSSGQSSAPSYFVGASADGGDAFIATASQLVPADRDQAIDVYDARIGGGLPSQQTGEQSKCEGEACLAAVAPPPTPSPPASQQVQGPGNRKHHAHKHKKHHKRKRKKGGKKNNSKNVTGHGHKGGDK